MFCFYQYSVLNPINLCILKILFYNLWLLVTYYIISVTIYLSTPVQLCKILECGLENIQCNLCYLTWFNFSKLWLSKNITECVKLWPRAKITLYIYVYDFFFIYSMFLNDYCSVHIICKKTFFHLSLPHFLKIK